ncbi:hypothetical protein [Hymenobacter sublimis]|uniref:Uncharacterized protein n=1 Tax=Hymenobacter sublimis TaxID=2933777 RepID=A0ABY4JAL4_9BACT|nr:hypothetical protein [Hymenobacter sublimis]UPL49858.1 hypothetical protein MWH26_02835 [Hymenobacter sublimis]
MELDDFRRKWQQQLVATEQPSALEAAALAQLLKQASRSSVATMLHNARLEIGFSILILAAGITGFLYAERLVDRLVMGWMVLLCVVSIVSYHRYLLKGLGDMRTAEASVRDQLTHQLQRVREVLRLSLRSSLWSLVISLGIPMSFSLVGLAREMATNRKMVVFGASVVFYAILGYGAFLLMRWLAKRYLYGLYGQHLDRLEAALRELGE